MIEILLIGIDVSINTRIITCNSSNSDFIDRTIVHIFDDDFIIRDVRYDTHMTVRTIVASTTELDNRSRDRFHSCFYASSFRISDPLIGIPVPRHTLMLRYIPSTISPCESSRMTIIFHFIAKFDILIINIRVIISCNFYLFYWSCSF